MPVSAHANTALVRPAEQVLRGALIQALSALPADTLAAFVHQDGVLLPGDGGTAAQQRRAAARTAPAAAVVAAHATSDIGLAAAGGGRPLKRRRSLQEEEARGENLNGHGSDGAELAPVSNGPVAEAGAEAESSDEGPTLGEQLAKLGIVPVQVCLRVCARNFRVQGLGFRGRNSVSLTASLSNHAMLS